MYKKRARRVSRRNVSSNILARLAFAKATLFRDGDMKASSSRHLHLFTPISAAFGRFRCTALSANRDTDRRGRHT
jgi:hypothetical protein